MKIKRLFFMLFIVVFSFSFVHAQGPEYYKGTFIISPAVGFNTYTIPFGATAEFGITDNIGIGGTAMFWFWGDSYWSNSLMSFSVDGSYHLTSIDVKKLDLFGGAGIGFSIYSWSWKSGYSGISGGSTGSGGLFIYPFFGARYFFSPKIAAFARLSFHLLGDWGGVGGIGGVSIRLK
ncbi:MAG: hypothetical protein JXB26_08110 [Candidatus Aminicenantes bacterium]|nr:hypothetical protein [Candidatus Aminicenantes bacterium]